MNQIILKNLKFKAFRSYVDPQDTGELPENGLIQIRGKSGSGKTNFHTVLSYIWGYAQFPDTELQSFLTKDKIQAELVYKFNGQTGILKRGKEEFSFNGINGSAKLVQSEIQKFIRIPIDLLEPLTVRHQRERSLFLSMTDSKKKEFLSKLLELEQFENIIKETSKEINLLELSATASEIEIETIKKILSEPVKPIIPQQKEKYDEIFKLKEKLIILQDELIGLKNSEEGYLINLKEFEIGIDQRKLEKREELFKSKPKSPFSEKIHSLKQELKQVELDLEKNKPSANFDTLSQKITNLESNPNCPECNQPLKDSGPLLEKLKCEFKEVTNIINLRSELIILKKKLMKELEQTMEDDSNFSMDFYVEIDKNINNIFNPSLISKRESVGQKLKPLRETIKSIQSEIYQISSIISRIQGEIDVELGVYGKMLNQYQTTYNKFVSDSRNLENLKKDLQFLQNCHFEKQDFVSLCKGFLGVIFEECLNEISLEANDMLKQIQNVSTVSVRFDTEKVNKNDTIRQEIRLIINKNGVDLPSFRTLSGGQQEAVELAIDLALGNVISRRSGIFPGWLILDEPFSGLGPEEKESCLEMLKIAARDRLVFVIDHSTESKEYFDYAIDVNNQNEKSKLWISRLKT